MKKYICAAWIMLLVFLCGCNVFDTMQIHIFSDIQECAKLEELKEPDATIEMVSSEEDRCLGELTYADYWGCSYKSKNISFTVYAYNFADADTANAYFYNRTQRENNREWNFLVSGGPFSYEQIVVSGSKAYILYAPTADKDEVTELINTVFSQELGTV